MRLLLALTIAFFAVTSSAQVDCDVYLPTDKGTKWEMTNYSAKGKETGKVTYELIDKVETDTATIYKIKTVSYDKKGEEQYSSTFEASCNGDHFHYDMDCMIDGEQMAAYKDMDVDVDASELELPKADAAAGTELADGSITIKMGTSTGMPMMKMTVNVTDRKVEGQESKTTPAGTFECTKLTQKVDTRIVMKIEASSTEWYSKDVGLVRSESYNKKGKLTGYSELTKLEVK